MRGFTKNIASCDFFLAGLRPLVLTRPSGPSAHYPVAPAPGFLTTVLA
jgi:hypothetical protein